MMEASETSVHSDAPAKRSQSRSLIEANFNATVGNLSNDTYEEAVRFSFATPSFSKVQLRVMWKAPSMKTDEELALYGGRYN